MVAKIIFCVTNITRIHHGVVLGGIWLSLSVPLFYLVFLFLRCFHC